MLYEEERLLRAYLTEGGVIEDVHNDDGFQEWYVARRVAGSTDRVFDGETEYCQSPGPMGQSSPGSLSHPVGL